MSSNEYTEDDTFLALRRLPWRQVFVMCLDGVSWGENVSTRRPDILKFANWTVEDFDARVTEAVLNEGLIMDIMIVTDKEWQEKFLNEEV
jgi:hypothetical protein